jgi:hypothetical protein
VFGHERCQGKKDEKKAGIGKVSSSSKVNQSRPEGSPTNSSHMQASDSSQSMK